MALRLSTRSCARVGPLSRPVAVPKAMILADSLRRLPSGPAARQTRAGRVSSILRVQGSRSWRPAPPAAAAAGALSSSDDDEAHDDTIELDIKVAGMSSGGCSERVASALRELAGVKAVSVDLAAELATVEVAAVSLMDALDMLPGLCETVQGLGFEAQPHIEHSC